MTVYGRVEAAADDVCLPSAACASQTFVHPGPSRLCGYARVVWISTHMRGECALGMNSDATGDARTSWRCAFNATRTFLGSLSSCTRNSLRSAVTMTSANACSDVQRWSTAQRSPRPPCVLREGQQRQCLLVKVAIPQSSARNPPRKKSREQQRMREGEGFPGREEKSAQSTAGCANET
jgi:hypothetical protein